LQTGLLTASPDGYAFEYVRGFKSDPEQRPLLGFSDVTRVYRSPALFPFFQQRVVEADRADRAALLGWLGLPSSAPDWEVLARGGGTRKGDRYELVAAPERTPSGGAFACVLARGLRFVGDDLGFESLESALEGLRPGMPLRVEVDVSNAVNPAARRLLAGDGSPIGWIPDVLVSYIAPRPSDVVNVRVAQVNGRDVPWHIRLLVDVEVPVSPQTSMFDAVEWQPVAVSESNVGVA
jgi:hypothetical protein